MKPCAPIASPSCIVRHSSRISANHKRRRRRTMVACALVATVTTLALLLFAPVLLRPSHIEPGPIVRSRKRRLDGDIAWMWAERILVILFPCAVAFFAWSMWSWWRRRCIVSALVSEGRIETIHTAMRRWGELQEPSHHAVRQAVIEFCRALVRLASEETEEEMWLFGYNENDLQLTISRDRVPDGTRYADIVPPSVDIWLSKTTEPLPDGSEREILSLHHGFRTPSWWGCWMNELVRGGFSTGGAPSLERIVPRTFAPV